MASLHSALHSLSPVNFDDVPKSPEQLDKYLADLHNQSQLILDSIPIPDADESHNRHRAQTWTSNASNASEISSSSARSDPPPSEHAKLQKEWGKPLKLSPKENTLGISVYKLSGKDGKGSWFARRSVHEGLGFARFMDAFEREFPTSLAVHGPPGEGNIRGIGAEKRVEDIKVPQRGNIEVYQLSAQFPGPTTPRDFVTFLATSSKAITPHGQAAKVPEMAPRHYMIISKPCNHPQTQPRDGFIRGQYESVEFIREIPRKLRASHSSTDLTQIEHGRKHEHDLSHDLLIKNAEKRALDLPKHHAEEDVSKSKEGSRDASPSGRRRSHTVADPQSPSTHHESHDDYDPEENPVEWIMVTRSDPGGSVPRFLVDRGTPASICADAVKFLDWACALKDNKSPTTPVRPNDAFRRESFTAFDGTHAKDISSDGVDDDSQKSQHEPEQQAPQVMLTANDATTDFSGAGAATGVLHDEPAEHNEAAASGIIASLTGALSTYAPQYVIDHIHGTAAKTSTDGPSAHATDAAVAEDVARTPNQRDADAMSTVSSLSFASADSHLSSDVEDQSLTSRSLQEISSDNTQTKNKSPHEHHLFKLHERKAALDAKFFAHREKLTAQSASNETKQQAALQRAEEKHKRETQKHEERYQKELKKIDEKKERERRKTEEKQKKQEEKTERERLRSERDAALEKVKSLEKDREVWKTQIGELQKENTALIARIGKYESGADAEHRNLGLGVATEATRSRSPSLFKKKKDTVEEMSVNSGEIKSDNVSVRS